MTDAKTRFCPSPTGLIHLGNVRTALFNALLAMHLKGQFLLRIEDTDKTRSNQHYIDALIKDLSWLGIAWQEGPNHDEGNGPYYQSKRQFVYDDYYQRLQVADKAYPCFCSEETLKLQRKIQQSSGLPPRYAGTCRFLTKEQRAEKIAQGQPATLRFAVSENETIEFEDLVHGPQTFNSHDIGDFIIRRANGTASFLFCNAIDDALMRVTHVLRGEDHKSNTPLQLMILDALGLIAPQYGHITLIIADDGRPLSKRHGSQNIGELRDTGYLPQALMNYLARLGHYYGHDHLLSLAELAEQFNLASLAKSPAKFNSSQLHYWQKKTVNQLDQPHFSEWTQDIMKDFIPEQHQALFFKTLKLNVTFPKEVMHWAKVLFSSDFSLNENQQALLKEMSTDDLKKALDFMNKYKTFTYEHVVLHLKSFSNRKGSALFMPFRIALTGERHGPELRQIFVLLGPEEVKRRLRQACTLLATEV